MNETVTLYTAEQLGAEVFCRLGASKIHGVGVFAIKDILEGTMFYKFASKRIKMTIDEWGKIEEPIKRILLDRNCYLKEFTDPGYYELDHPNAHQEFIIFMNHDENPNSNGYAADRFIVAGEEVTERYWSIGFESRQHMVAQGVIKY